MRLDVDNRPDQLVGQDIRRSSIHDRWGRTHRTSGSESSDGRGHRSRRTHRAKLTLLERRKTKPTTSTTCSIAIGESGSNTIGLEVVDKRVVELDRGLEDQVREDARGRDNLGLAGKADRLRGDDMVCRRGDAVKTNASSSA